MKRKKLWAFVVIGIWVLLAIGMQIIQPDVDELMRTKGQPSIPKNYSSFQASEISKLFNGYDENANVVETLIVFDSKTKMQETDEAAISRWVGIHKSGSIGESKVLSMTDPFSSQELRDNLVSKDGKSIMLPVVFNNGTTVPKLKDEIKSSLEKELLSTLNEDSMRKDGNEINCLITGNKYINEDQITSTKAGMKKTEIVTILFILLVLILVFRSIVTPLVTLACIIMAYLTSYNIVLQLVDKMNFPFSTTTQGFLIFILFGIGTDYSILLLSRYKEEMAKGVSTDEALHIMRNKGGKTVLISASAVFIGFSLLALSEFSIFRSATAVSIGILLLLGILFTVLPAFIRISGKYLFFPSKVDGSHRDNRWWGAWTSKAVKYPLVTLLIISILFLPGVILNNKQMSFNPFDEIGNQYESVQAMNLLEKQFGIGKAFPVTVWLGKDTSWENNEGINRIGQLTAQLEKVNNVKSVYSVTSPAGKSLEEITVRSQSTELAKGTEGIADGLSKLSDGLGDMKNKIPSEGGSSISLDPLIKGNEAVYTGLAEVENALHKLENGTVGVAQGLEEVRVSTEKLLEGTKQLDLVLSQLPNQTAQLAEGTKALTASYAQISQGVGGLYDGMSLLEKQMQNFILKNPNLAGNQDLGTMKGTITNLKVSCEKISIGMKQTNSSLDLMAGKMTELSSGVTVLSSKQSQLVKGWQSIHDGITTLEAAAAKTKDGNIALAKNMPSLLNGINELGKGQKKIEKELNNTVKQFGNMGSAMDNALSGINDMTEGVNGIDGYLKDSARNSDKLSYFIPEETFNDDKIQELFGNYFGAHSKVTKLSLELTSNPYSQSSMKTIDEAERIIRAQMPEAKFSFGGITSINRDLNTIVNKDFARTTWIMIIGLFLVLLIITKSIKIAGASMISLVCAYYTSITVVRAVVVGTTGAEGLAWAVPFFSFIIIMSVGVDYIVFLSLRYLEYKDMSAKAAVVEAARKMGGIIQAAAVILIGTFSSIYPSGILTLMQIASVTIVAVIILNVLMLPLVLPAVISLEK